MPRAEDIPRMNEAEWRKHFGDGCMCNSKGGRTRISDVHNGAKVRMQMFDELPLLFKFHEKHRS